MIIYPEEDIQYIINDWLDRLIGFGKIVENENFPITVGDVADLSKRIGNIVTKANKNLMEL